MLTTTELGPLVKTIAFTQVSFDPYAVRQVRRWLGDKMLHFPEELRMSAQVIMSELVTNAIKHAIPVITASLALRIDGYTVQVTDGSSMVPTLTLPVPADQDHGRGLRVVDELAERWGYWTSPGHKCVFAVLKPLGEY